MGSLRRLVQPGAQFEICAVVGDSGLCKVEDFLKDLQRSNPHVHKRLVATMSFIADYGHHDLGPQKFEIVRERVFEIKDRAGIRLLGFFDANRKQLLVIERGWKKGKKREQSRQIEEVYRFMKSFTSREWYVEL